MARVIQLDHTGGPEVLHAADIPTPDPGPGELLVRHTAIGVNFIDTYHRSGLYPLAKLPSGIGSEAAGVVEAIGSGVHGFSLGERVAYATGPLGAYADLRVVPAERVVKLPPEIDDVTAAAMMLKGMTVEYLIRRTYAVQSGQTVLWQAAAGGVGLIACQWLRHLGVTVIGTVSSDEKARLAEAHGCAHTIVYTRENFPQRVRELTANRGVPVVYDSVGRTTFLGSLDCLSPRGTMVAFGNASGKPEPFDQMLLAQKGSLYLTRPTLHTYTASRQELLDSANALFEVVKSGAVRIEVQQRFALDQAADAHRALEARATTGSTVLLP